MSLPVICHSSVQDPRFLPVVDFSPDDTIGIGLHGTRHSNGAYVELDMETDELADAPIYLPICGIVRDLDFAHLGWE